MSLLFFRVTITFTFYPKGTRGGAESEIRSIPTLTRKEFFFREGDEYAMSFGETDAIMPGPAAGCDARSYRLESTIPWVHGQIKGSVRSLLLDGFYKAHRHMVSWTGR